MWLNYPNITRVDKMAYEIEDIDWNKMPEGAVEFSLEDEEYFFTWYDGYNSFQIEGHSVWQDDNYDERKRHKVSDYHPSANRKSTREERLDKALRALVQRHFFGNGLEWSWKEGKSLEDMDPSLYKEIVNLLK